jgi:uncharacterized membrane protein
MLNFLCSIPNWLGWTIAGGLAILCGILLYVVGKEIVTEIKIRIEERKEEKEIEIEE